MSGFRREASRTSTTPHDDLGAAPSGPAPTDADSAFRKDVKAARRALAQLVGSPLHRRGRVAVPSEPRTVPSADLIARLRMGLEKEHEFVLVPLLDRLDHFARRLTDGKDVPPAVLEEGLSYVDRYLQELHDGHLGILRQAEADPAKGVAARLVLQTLLSDYDHARVRWATVRVMLRGYEQKILMYQVLLGLTLAQECRSERAWHEFEEEYVRTSIAPMFTAKVAEIWLRELDRSRDEGRADRVKIADFVERTAEYAKVPE
jgi:hypothetical protein